MGKEIERKFLVRNNEWKAQVRQSYAIVQGYICMGPPASVRVRTKGERGYLNIKQSTTDLERSEYEYEIPIEEARELLNGLCVGARVEKTRYDVMYGGLKWEIDVFEGANQGLVLAEVEIKERNELVDVPLWISEEVSGDIRFFNTYLALTPYGTWKQ